MPLDQTIAQLSMGMHQLAPERLAELRRMEVEGPGTASFWQLAAQCGFMDSRPEIWMRIVKVMAILASKGESGGRLPLHDAKRRLGAVLCDGGGRHWRAEHGTLRPFISETRLARFLAQAPDQRGQTLERMARMLANNLSPESGVNCTDIAVLLHSPNDQKSLQDIARTYYQRLDTAMGKASQKASAA